MKHVFLMLFFLILISCNQNRNDEYFCKPISQGKYKDLYLEIYKDTVKTQSDGEPQYTYSILEENSDRIKFGYKMKGNQMKQVFYKKTKKFKWDSSIEKTSNSFSIVYDCKKLN